jgi:ferric-dicitrate binding protein FerR (iron transport regulator)
MSDCCENLELYHHRGLGEAERRDVEAHLNLCPDCRAGLDEYREVDDVLRDALSHGKDEAFWNDMAGRVGRRIEDAPPRRRRLAVTLSAAAAAAAIVLLIGLPYRTRPAAVGVVAPRENVAPEPTPLPAPPVPAPVRTAAVRPEPSTPRAVAPPRTAPPEQAELPLPIVTPSYAPPPKPAPAATVAARARIERMRGDVFVGQVRPLAGQDLLPDQELLVTGPGSLAVLVQADGTRLEMGVGRIAYPAASPGAVLAEGRLAVDVADRETRVFTGHAEVRARAARFLLGADAASTRIEVTGGSAELRNLLTGSAAIVPAGQQAFVFGQAGVDDKRVAEAIRQGIEYLRTAESPPGPYGVKSSDELILLTFIDAGIPEGDPKVQELLKKVVEAPLETTYNVALQAMALEELHRVKYQGRIAQCAQFLLDNQCKNGQWSYGKPTIAATDLSIPSVGAGADAPSGGRGPGVVEFGAVPVKPKVKFKINIKKTREGIDAGDNSNSQYAALGMRACHDAGIVFPKEAVALARKYWTESAIGDAGKSDAVATGGKALGVPQGWCYKGYHHQLKYCKSPDNAYTSMTAGAVGAVTIYDFMMGVDWKKDKTVLNGLAWLVKNWSWTENVGPCEISGGAAKAWLYYGFYAIERVGMLYDTPKIGAHDWYLEGAAVILDAQKPGGAWSVSGGAKPTWDTCFAILFLKRATRPLDVASQDTRRPAK